MTHSSLSSIITERPAVGNETERETRYCLEVEHPDTQKLLDAVANKCIKVDIWESDTSGLALPTECSDECKAAMAAWADPSTGWGCCVEEYRKAMKLEPDMVKVVEFIEEQFTKCSIEAPKACGTPDGAEISATFTIDNFNVAWWKTAGETIQKETEIKNAENIAQLCGVSKSGVTLTIATSEPSTLTINAKVVASGAEQGAKVMDMVRSVLFVLLTLEWVWVWCDSGGE